MILMMLKPYSRRDSIGTEYGHTHPKNVSENSIFLSRNLFHLYAKYIIWKGFISDEREMKIGGRSMQFKLCR